VEEKKNKEEEGIETTEWDKRNRKQIKNNNYKYK
jgi:hypothetical protein